MCRLCAREIDCDRRCGARTFFFAGFTSAIFVLGERFEGPAERCGDGERGENLASVSWAWVWVGSRPRRRRRWRPFLRSGAPRVEAEVRGAAGSFYIVTAERPQTDRRYPWFRRFAPNSTRAP